MEFTNQSLKFKCEALPDDPLLLTRLHGDESLSGLFRFDLELISADPAIDLTAVVGKPAKVGIAQQLGLGMKTFRWFSGFVSELEELEQGQGWTRYRAVLLPILAQLGQFYRSRVFQEMTIDELVGEVLGRDLGMQEGVDFAFKLTRAEGDRKERAVYPEREYAVQFEETDLDFVSRWLEHEGIFYFFENDGTQEKVVFADAVSAYKPVVSANSTYPYRPQSRSASTAGADEDAVPEEVLSFRGRVSVQPKRVTLNDYNWRDPAVQLQSSEDVDQKGLGLQNQYNDHYKTTEQGKALAGVRAGEWTCRHEVFQGDGTVRMFRPGRTFTLEEHFRKDWNRDYLLVRVRHEADQAINVEASTVTGANYQNTFEAIPADRVFRPARRTPWPAIRGAMHARVDGEGDGEFAELDPDGRYKLILPFDDNKGEAGPGKASRWVRMAQPYAGVDSGFHFPLLKGTEVLVTHIDGDPDRPVIAAAVPNPETHSPVDQGNQRQNRIRTTSGNLIVLDDDPDQAGFLFMDSNLSNVQDFRLFSGNAKGGGGGGGGSGGAPGAEAAARRARTAAAAAAVAAARASAATPARREPGALAAEGPPGEGLAVEGPPGEAPAGKPAHPAGEVRLWTGGPVAPVDPAEAKALIERLIKNGRKLPPGTRRRLGGGSGTATEEEEPTTLEAFFDQNPTAKATVDAGTPLINALGGIIPAEYTLWSRCFEALVDVGIHNTFTFLKGNTYTYADISVDVSFGTGGEAFHQEAGDTISQSFTLGNQTSFSFTLGIESTTSITIGAKNTMEIALSHNDSTTLSLSGAKGFSFTAGASASVEIKLSAEAKASLVLSGTAEFSLTIGLGVKIELGLGGYFEFKLAAAPKIALQIAVEDIETKIPDSQEVRLSKMETNLSDIQNELNAQQNILNDTKVKLNVTKTDLNETKTRLSETETKLTATETALNATKTKLAQTETMLNKSTMALSKRTTALADEVSALSTTQTAIIHTIT